MWDCSDYSVVPEINAITSSHRGPRAAGGAKIGFVMTSFLSKPVGSPRYPWDLPKSYTNMDGKTIVDSKFVVSFIVAFHYPSFILTMSCFRHMQIKKYSLVLSAKFRIYTEFSLVSGSRGHVLARCLGMHVFHFYDVMMTEKFIP